MQFLLKHTDFTSYIMVYIYATKKVNSFIPRTVRQNLCMISLKQLLEIYPKRVFFFSIEFIFKCVCLKHVMTMNKA